jgi:tetratricopeptide (TPR) repeat protein
MRLLACAGAGLARERPCLQRNSLELLDEELLALSDRVAAARNSGQTDYVLRRGAMLHADVAMSSGGVLFEGMSTPPASAAERLTISVEDGRDSGIFFGAVHWDIARNLLDHIRPAGDPMVRLWYHATAAWMQAHSYHENVDHLTRALSLFPKDPDLLFLSGCEHESFARPSIQAAVRSVKLPPGYDMAVQSEEVELRQAETRFRRALDERPAFVEARIRLGRVLLMRGRGREAAEELRRASTGTDEDLLKYFSAMFLGAAEEAIGNGDAAAALYDRASSLYPNAQSPHLAQSALARRRNDRAGALSAIERVFQRAAADPDGDDPWWKYDLAAGRHADTLLTALQQFFKETSR